MGDHINSKDFIIGTLIGGMVGATAALLLAPKSGKELRDDINQGATQAKDMAYDWKDVAQVKGSELKEVAYDKGSELKQKAKESTGEIAKNVTDKTQELTKTVQEKIDFVKTKEDEALDAVEDVAKSVAGTADDLKSK